MDSARRLFGLIEADWFCNNCCCTFGDIAELQCSGLWLPSESSLERDDGGVGGNPKPAFWKKRRRVVSSEFVSRFRECNGWKSRCSRWNEIFHNQLPCVCVSIRMFNFGTTSRCCVPFNMICWFFSRLWEADDSCNDPFCFSNRQRWRQMKYKWKRINEKNSFKGENEFDQTQLMRIVIHLAFRFDKIVVAQARICW